MSKIERWIVFVLVFALVAALFCFAAFAEGETTEKEQPEQPPTPTIGQKIAFIAIGVCIFGGIAVFLRWRFVRRARYNNYTRYY